MIDKECCENMDYKLYKLSKGESLKQVAIKLKIPAGILSHFNSGIQIAEGVTIAIPNINLKTYFAKCGESVEDICNKFSITKDEYIQKNGGLLIYEGMKIYL